MMAEYSYKELSTDSEAEKWDVLLRLCEGLAPTIRPLRYLRGDCGLRQTLWLSDEHYLFGP